MHYTFVLVLIMGLFAATHIVNKTIIAHSAAATDALHAAHTQITSENAVMLAAEQFAASGRPSAGRLETAIAEFRQTNESLPQRGLWSPKLEQHFYLGDTALNQKIERFLTLATELAARPPETRRYALNRLRNFHADADLTAMQQETIALFETRAEARGRRLADLQQTIFMVTAFVLLGEAVFIFMPAQLSVLSSIAELHSKTDVMKRSQEQLEYLVNHDALTGLPNRSCMVKHLERVIRAHPHSELGVLFVGLDDFKSLNDTAGHEYGDSILQAVARRFENCVDSEDMVARVGGDEFLLVTSEQPETLAARLMKALADPFTVLGRKLSVRASIGYLTAKTPDADALSMIGDAGMALQAAKTAGGNRVQQYAPSLRRDFEMLQKLQQELPDAIANGQLEPWFQPQIRLSDGKIHGAEVLARWRHPIHGLLSPDKFLPAAVRAGLMIDLDHAIWQSAMRHVRQWQSAGSTIPHISLNAAPETISDPNLIERFLLLLHLSGLCADQIVIEVLETTVIDGADDMASINIDSLAECGVSLELDDFGTGYASLSKLTQLPLAGIKLDRSLVAPLPNAAAESVIRAILALALELGLQVVAEGIEQDDQARSLNAFGCAVGQGYGFARPMSADDFHIWLRNNAATTKAANTAVVTFPKRA